MKYKVNLVRREIKSIYFYTFSLFFSMTYLVSHELAHNKSVNYSALMREFLMNDGEFMMFSLASPFMGLAFQLNQNKKTAELTVANVEGDILPILAKIELSLAEQGAEHILLLGEMDLLHHPRLIKLHYQQTQSGWLKHITYKKSVRFSITEKCNYHCFFCHEEGMEMKVKRHAVDHTRFFDVIDQLAALDYNDFTFTGGEPLLNWRGIDACLSHMERIGYLPEITIVTNGEKLSENIIARLKAYPGFVRINLSLHSLINDDYLQIVHRMKKPNMGADDLLDRIKGKMALLKAAEIPFKLNIVLLKGLNTSPESIDAILNYAEQSGATAVKFLELLITEQLQNFYSYFFTLASVKEMLGERLRFLWQNHTKDVYQYENSALQVELQHCTCARGCNTCPLNRGVTFTAEMKFFPCFLRPEDHYFLDDNNLAACIAKGDDDINRMAAYYQDNSPILIKEAYSTKSESAYFYLINEAQQARIGKLLSGKLSRIREFKECYFSSKDLPALTYRKYIINSYDLTALEIYQTLFFGQDGAQHTEFHHKGIVIHDIHRYLNIMHDKGYQNDFALNWKLSYFTQENGSGYSISENRETGLRFLRTEAPFDELTLGLTPLTMPLVDIVRKTMAETSLEQEVINAVF